MKTLAAIGQILAPGDLDASYACGCRVSIRRGQATKIQPCAANHCPVFSRLVNRGITIRK